MIKGQNHGNRIPTWVYASKVQLGKIAYETPIRHMRRQSLVLECTNNHRHLFILI